eukprot:scaffold18197_cov122-Isochrysis_galbana.AAC.1
MAPSWRRASSRESPHCTGTAGEAMEQATEGATAAGSSTQSTTSRRPAHRAALSDGSGAPPGPLSSSTGRRLRYQAPSPLSAR